MNRRWLGFAFAVATLVFSLSVMSSLPDRVATHFNGEGVPDGWMSRTPAALMLPLLAVLMMVAFHMLPRISPRRANFERFEDSYWLIANACIAFLCAVHVLILGRALGWPIDISSATMLGIGLFFMIIGNVLPRTRSNWWMGIRTPWTMESERVWRETHRLAGKTFMAGGAFTVVAALLPGAIRPWVGMGALIVAGFVPVVYSYVVWRREKTA